MSPLSPDSPQRGSPARPFQILLVEDNPADDLLAREAFRAAKARTVLHRVEDGLEALAFVRRQGRFKDAPRPDLVLLDLNLPRMDGRETLAELKSDPRLRTIPVLVLTTSEAEEDVAGAYGLHANGYLRKPVEYDHFVALVAAIDGFWLGCATLPEEAPAETPVASAAEAWNRVNTARLLLIEDSPSDVFLFEAALAESNALKFEFTHAGRLAAARSLMRNHGFDVVIVDLGLPDSNGLATLREVQTLGAGAAVIVLTGLDDEEAGLAALREGAQDFIVKGQMSGRALVRAIRYARDRRRIEDQLRQAQRDQTVGQLAAGVAHDFNNLLQVIRAEAELLALGPAGRRPEVAETTRQIIATSDRAASLTRQLLTYGRQQRMDPAPLNLNDVVAGLAPLLRRTIGGAIRLDLTLKPGLPTVRADPGMLEQVVMNLVIHARDGLPGGGPVSLATAQVDFDASPTEAAPRFEGAAGRYAALAVTYPGRPLAAEEMRRAFEPFALAGDPGCGTGLGLAMVSGVAQRHGGGVAVRSTPGRGTEFWVYLPALGAPPEPGEKIDARTRKILLVEDDDVLRGMVATVLLGAGHEVVEAASGECALARWEENQNGLDLVITDLVMPDGMNGDDLGRRLAALRPELPVIYMSGYGADAAAEWMLREGVAFLAKPFSVDDLLALVRAKLEQAPG